MNNTEKQNLPTPQQVLALAKAVKRPVVIKRGRESVLKPYVESITYLHRKRGFNFRQVSDFLNKAGVKNHYQNFTTFARKNNLGKIQKRSKAS